MSDEDSGNPSTSETHAQVVENTSQPPERPQWPVKRKRDAFGAALADLLAPAEDEDAEGQQREVSATSQILAEKPFEPDPTKKMKRQHEKEREKRKLKRLISERGHNTQPEFNDVERRMVRVATKGVVTLFNAVATSQRELKKVDEEDGNRRDKRAKVEELSKDGFLKMLKSKAGSSSSKGGESKDETDADAAESSGKAAGGKKGWSLLSDNYLMGAKMKDWDKDAAAAGKGKGKGKQAHAKRKGGDDDEDDAPHAEGRLLAHGDSDEGEDADAGEDDE